MASLADALLAQPRPPLDGQLPVGVMDAVASPIAFPNDPRAVLNVKTDFGAVGDGVADDTNAIQAAIEAAAGADYTRVVYIPDGTYRITHTLVFKPPGSGEVGSMVGPWIYGQSRDGTIIRLADGAAGFGDPNNPLEAIRGVPRPDGAGMNADFFDRKLINLTIDTGNNPGAVGVKFYSNNTGVLRDVLIRGNGAVGLDMGFLDQNGPLLIQNVEIDGFAIGILTSHTVNSQTLSQVTVRNASTAGLRQLGQVLSVEGLTVINAPLAVDLNDGVLTLIDSHFEASGGATGPAIRAVDATLYAARITTSGFARAIQSDAPAGNVNGDSVSEYSSHAAIQLGPDATPSGLQLTPVQAPDVPLPTDPSQWVCANDYGAAFGDEVDDAPAIQAAIDAAAASGASTVYLLGGKRGDPNWYYLRQNVTLHGSVQRIFGFGFVRILSGTGDDSVDDPNYPQSLYKFIVPDEVGAPQTVVFQNLQVFSPWESFGVDVQATHRTVVFDAFGGTPLVGPGATVFMSNCAGHLYMQTGSTVWARQYNTERGPAVLGINTINDGGQLWVLGMKTEAFSTKVQTVNGGRTEMLGVLNYNTAGAPDNTPYFRVIDAAMSVAGYLEVHWDGSWWRTTVQATYNGHDYVEGQQVWHSWSLLRAGGQYAALPQFAVGAPSYSVGEADGSVSISVTLSEAAAQTTSVQYATLDGTAVAGRDYTTTSGLLQFSPGQQSATIQVPILDNALDDGQRTFTIQLSAPSLNASLGGQSTATITITDDEPTVLPTVEDIQLVPDRRRIAAVNIAFSTGMQIAPGSGDVQLLARGALGKGPSRPVPLASSSFDLATNTLTLTPVRPLPPGRFYQVLLGMYGTVTDLNGTVLDGDGDGRAGGGYCMYFARGRAISYADHDGDIVNLHLRGGGSSAMLELLRCANGDGVRLTLSDAGPDAILSGNVSHRRGGDGLTTLNEIVAPNGMRNRLRPSILVNQIS